MINRGCNRSAIVDSWPKLREEGTVCRIYPSPMKELSMVEHVKKKGFNLQVEKVYEKKKFERKTKDFYGTGSGKKVTTLSKELARGEDKFVGNDDFTARRVKTTCYERLRHEEENYLLVEKGAMREMLVGEL